MWGLGRDGEEETVSIVSIPHSDVQLPARVVQTLDSAIHRINHYPADSVIIDLRNTYPLDSD